MKKFELKKYAGNPILSPKKENDWESLVTCNPAAWYEDGTFYLLYRAAGNDVEHVIHLGLATSKDGFNFKRVQDTPVLSPDPKGFDEGCVEDPRITKMGNLFYVTYATRSFPPGQYWLDPKDRKEGPWLKLPEEFTPNGLRWNLTHTALAISEDLVNYKKLGRITQYDFDNRDVILFPEKINGKYVRLERPMEMVGPKYGVDVPSMWINYSDNLMEWGEPKLLATREFYWENKKLGGSTPPLRTKNGWLVIYHGVCDEGTYRVGAMLLDLENPEKILARTKESFMEPEFPYETDGFYHGCVFPTGNVIVGDTLYVYYGGADRFCCVATCSLEELLAHLRKNKVK